MLKMNFNILIVDDEQDYCDVMEMIFSSKGYHVDTCNDGYTALKKLKDQIFDLVLTDLMMPEMDGSELLSEVKKRYPTTAVIIMTAYGTIEKAVETMKHGAYTYVTKGDNPESLLSEIAGLQSLKYKMVNAQPTEVKSGLVSDFMLTTNSPTFKKVLSMAAKAAKSNANILILGESGSGKEVIARYIHENSNRKEYCFLDLNCHSIPETVLESELFGHEKGSFTGAVGKRVGRFEAADHGTLFLDEIGDIPLSMQAKLLKVLENKTISRVGSNAELKVDFRLLTATNKNLEDEMIAEHFREDLFYRLSTIVIPLPPLRQRKEDLPLLIEHFFQKSKAEMGLDSLIIAPSIMQSLLQYDYPGNIRELKNIIERLVVFSENGMVQNEMTSFSEEKIPTENTPSLEYAPSPASEKTLRELRKELESTYIESVLKNYRNDMNKVSEVLGITRRQLLNKLTEYGLKQEKSVK